MAMETITHIVLFKDRLKIT
jgi:hypothetical protein